MQLQQLDQYQQLEWLMSIDEEKAGKLFDSCKEHRKCCTKPTIQPVLKSLELQLEP